MHLDCSEKPTTGSLFSGVGGIDLGFERAGWQVIWQVEKDSFCSRVLAKHWPGVDRYGDIRDFPPANIRRPDIIVGGFPCQPHSVAGKRRGAADDRNLWPEFLRIVREVRPAWVLAENVPGIVSLYLDTVLADLEGEGYTCWTFNIPACAFNAPHRRQRIFVVAHTESHIRRTPRDERPLSSDGSSSFVAYPKQHSHRSKEFCREVRGQDTARPTSRISRPSDGGREGDVADAEQGASGGGAVARPSNQQGRRPPATEPKSLQSTNGQAYPSIPEQGGQVVAYTNGQDYAQHDRPRRLGKQRGISITTRAEATRQANGKASNNGPDGYGEIVADTDAIRRDGRARQQRTGRRLELKNGGKDVADATGQSRNGGNDNRRGRPQPIPQFGNSVEETRPVSSWWAVEPDVGRVAHGIPNRVDRLRGLGNAVVPQVAEWIGKQILATEVAIEQAGQ